MQHNWDSRNVFTFDGRHVMEYFILFSGTRERPLAWIGFVGLRAMNIATNQIKLACFLTH